ncbi:MAG: methylated-DNA--[Bacteroidales bacterium]|nr:methylated-DNA--[protein]-cysteine S-methyltransferase [Bacteroidales bacterium]
MILTAHCDTPLGGITLAGEGDCLVGLWFDGQAHFGELPGRGNVSAEEWARPGRQAAQARPGLPVFEEARRWLDVYFSGREPDFTPPVGLRGTPFQRAVWAQLLLIPYGQTVTYGQLARQLDTSARAVGGAVGYNPVSLIVPCHRVVGAAGRLTGYAGGLDRKVQLLELEKAR